MQGIQAVRTCENEGASVGNKPCPRKATHRVTIWRGEDEYESFLCPECFAGFREQMVERGMPPRNEMPAADDECRPMPLLRCRCMKGTNGCMVAHGEKQ